VFYAKLIIEVILSSVKLKSLLKQPTVMSQVEY